MFTFEWPWLGLLLPLPFLLRYLLPPKREEEGRGVPALYFPALDRLQNVFSVERKRFSPENTIFFILLSLLWGALVIAVMRPQMVDQLTQVQHEGYDLMLAVDISGSMKALDFSTPRKAISRLDVTKDVVGQFVRDRKGDRVGLILFGENAYLQVPLTLDTPAVEQMLSKAIVGMAGEGTAIGDAIGLAVRNLRERPEGSRVLILLTDGLDTASSLPPLEATRLAKQYGIRIYTIGIGNKGQVPYPTDWGGVVMAEVPLDEKLLKEIASTTGGEYFRATDQQALEEIYDRINSLEKTKANVRTYFIRNPLHVYPLGVAALLLLLIGLLPVIRRGIYGR